MAISSDLANVEILRGVEPGVVVLRELSSRIANAILVGHVIDDGIHDDVDVVGVAGLNHRGKLLTGAKSALELVANRLVHGPPLLTEDVLLRRGDHCPANALL